MKKVILIVFAFFFSSIFHAQSFKRDAIYLSADAIIGNYSGVELGVNFLDRQNLSIRVAAHGIHRTSGQNVEDWYVGPHFLVRKTYTNGGLTRWNLSAGIGVSVEPNSFGVFCGGPDILLTGILNPKIEFPFSQVIGLSISSYLLINKDVLAVGIGIMLGSIK